MNITLTQTFASLRHRNYQLFFFGQLVSSIGTWMQIIAQGWVVYQIGHSEMTLGWVAFASAIPNLVISPWAGVIVDRVSRRNVQFFTQFGSMLLAFILAFLTFSGLVREWHIIILAAVLGIVNAFDAPARQAFMVDIVEKEDIPNAIALNSMMFNSARILGPSIAGFLLVLLGAGWCFSINGLSFLAVIIALFMMDLPLKIRKPSIHSPWNQLKGGLIYSAKNREILGMILLSLVFSTFGISYATILPAFVDRILHQGPIAYGWLNAATGLGAVTGALVLAQPLIEGKRGKILLYTNLLFPFVLMVFANNPFFTFSLPLIYLLGIGFMMQFTTLNTLLQTRVEDEFRGRVMALYSITFFGIAPLGNLFIGFLGEKIGLSMSVSIFAVICLFLQGLILVKIPEVHRL